MDGNFIRLFDSFDKAKGGNPNIASLQYRGFIMQLPNETFLQQTNLTNGIAFSGAIQVDLIDSCQNVKKNIDSNFYYESFIDDNAIPQITFEFGLINQNFYTLPLYLRITDLVNGAVFYSNDFLVTDYNSSLSAGFDYGSVNGFLKSIRFSNMYDFTPVNENTIKQYTTTQGLRVNSKSITTYLRQWKCDAINYDINDRLNELFASDIIFLNSQGVVISDYKANERKGLANFLDTEFIVNAQNEVYNWSFQVYEGFEVVSIYPIIGSTITANNIYVLGTSPQDVAVFFNKFGTLRNGAIAKLYRNNVLLETITTPSNYQLNDDKLFLDFAYFNPPLITDIENGNFYIVVYDNDITSGAETFKGFALNEWTFTIADGEFLNTDFDNTEFLTN